MNSVAIVGVGLIGGSFGLALRGAGFAGEIIGVSSEKTIAAALTRGAIDRGAELGEAVSAADLVYLAQPIGRILSTLRLIDEWVQPHALVTDAGSTKQVILDAARQNLRHCAFLGGHPMAGKELRGVEHAEPDLFAGRPYILTPGDAELMNSGIAHAFRGWLEKIGAQVRIMSADEHDHAMAFSSHLPQIAATALASVLAGQDVIPGPGVIGATRLALSSYDIWRDILLTNAEPIREALTSYIQTLEHLRDNLQTREMREEFERAAKAAQEIRTPSMHVHQ